MPIYGLGIDPDIKALPIVAVESSTVSAVDGFMGRLHAVYMVRVPKHLKEDAAVLSMVQRLSSVAYLGPGQLLYLLHVPAVSVVEGQQMHERKRNHDDILRLGQVAGAALSAVSLSNQLFMPRPSAWKGSVPKPIHQARTLKRLGIEYVQQKGGSKPTQKALKSLVGQVRGIENVKTEEWGDVVDAAGLALWGLKQVFESPVCDKLSDA